MTAHHAAVLLAAGAGRRFAGHGHKLTAQLPASNGRPAETVIQRAFATTLNAQLDHVVVVTGRLGVHELGLEVAPIDGHRAAVEVVHNPDWELGQATSVAAGLAAADRAGVDAAVIGLADQPGILPDAWRAVADRVASGAAIAVATYEGRRANPVGLHRRIWSMVPTTGDVGARSIMRIHPELVVEVPCPGSPDDIDTAEDLRRWQSS